MDRFATKEKGEGNERELRAKGRKKGKEGEINLWLPSFNVF